MLKYFIMTKIFYCDLFTDNNYQDHLSFKNQFVEIYYLGMMKLF